MNHGYTFSETVKLNLIRKTVTQYLLGFEITETKNNYIVIENITEPKDEKSSVLAKRIFLQISTFKIDPRKIFTKINWKRYSIVT